ncbi:MAG: hypothetical protein ACRD43_08355, partial [Pyrinomonadaceae bacterium]
LNSDRKKHQKLNLSTHENQLNLLLKKVLISCQDRRKNAVDFGLQSRFVRVSLLPVFKSTTLVKC